MSGGLEKTGHHYFSLIEAVGRMGLFLLQCLFRAATPPVKLYPVVQQIHFIGARSSWVVVTAGLFTGMVVALQFYDTLVRFGSVDLLGSAVALSLIRELGPVITALMVTGRAGSAICAEIGIMRISEQIDALECMGIDPYRFFLTPKLLAGLVAVPVLTILFDLAGLVGGWFVGVVLFGVGEGTYVQGLRGGIEWNDVAMGLVKSIVFGGLIVWFCAAKGYFLHYERAGAFGPEGVSRVTTNAVVLSSVSVLFADYLIGSLML
jgi:phospholipid/cholesterol/gamma-HCH transport system permease protein